MNGWDQLYGGDPTEYEGTERELAQHGVTLAAESTTIDGGMSQHNPAGSGTAHGKDSINWLQQGTHQAPGTTIVLYDLLEGLPSKVQPGDELLGDRKSTNQLWSNPSALSTQG
jgi:hypothetical protein